MYQDGRLEAGCLGALGPIHEGGTDYQGYQNCEFWDDLSGAPLRKEGVIKARIDELGQFKKHTVYLKRPMKENYEVTGKGPIGVRWIDISKGDAADEEYRSRVVAQEVNNTKAKDNIFAATPPLESKKMLFSLAVTEGIGYGEGWQYKLEFIDIKRAYFYAPAKRDVHIKLPEEDAEEGMCGKLAKSMYGTHDAAYNWEEEYTKFMIKNGFIQGKSNPCLFYHPGKDIRAVIYGDDFTMLGSDDALDWFRKAVEKKLGGRYEISHKGRLGPEKHDDKRVRLLNRVIEWTHEGIRYEADQRHAEIIVKLLGVGEKSSLSTPGDRWYPKHCSDEDLKELTGEKAKLYRAVAARANYLAQDRSDIRYSVKELCRHMSKPRNIDYNQLIRFGRYLVGKMRVINKFDYQKDWKIIDTWTDTDHGGCPETRKSNSGGVIMFGTHAIKHWSTPQSIIALSSGEAEYYGCVRAAAQTMGVKSLLIDLNVIGKRIPVKIDASVATSLSSRRGLGSIKNLEVNQLWLQEKVNTLEIEIEKVKGEVNRADAFTKCKDSVALGNHVKWTLQSHAAGRHELMPKVSEENIVIEGSEILPNDPEELGSSHCLNTNDDYKAEMAAYRPECICGRPVFTAGLSCGRDVCQFHVREAEEKIKGLRGTAAKVTEKMEKAISTLLPDDSLDCLTVDVRDVEKRGNAEIMEIRRETEAARKEIMDSASVRLEKLMLTAHKREGEVLQRISQETCTLRKKAFKDYQAEVGTALTMQLEQSEKKAVLIARAQAIEVYSVMSDLQLGRPTGGKGGRYGPDVTNSRYGKGDSKGDGRAQPYRDPGQSAASTAVLRTNQASRDAEVTGVRCLIAGEFIRKTDDAYIRGGVIDEQRGGLVRADVTKPVSVQEWFRGSPIGKERHRYFDGRNQEEVLITKQMAIDDLIDNQLPDSAAKREQFRVNFRMSVEEYYTQERQSLRSEVVNPSTLEARGTYPWYMWKRAHFNRVFQREVSHQKKNRGLNNELCVVNIPSDYVSNLTENGEFLKGVSCYTVYVKGIPWDFREGSFIKKCLEYGPLAACYLEREEESERLTGIVYVKFKYPCSVEAMISEGTERSVRDDRGRNIPKGWKVRAEGGAPRTVYAVYSRVEVVIPGYPNEFRNQMSEDPEIRRWAIALNFNVMPRYAGEFTKELLQAPWLWGNLPAPAEAVVTEMAAPVVSAAAGEEEAELITPPGTHSVAGSTKDEDEEMSQHS